MVLSSPEILKKVEELLGIKGKSVKVPSIMGRPTVEVPILYVILVGVLLYVGGPRAVLPLIAVGYFLMTTSADPRP